MGRPDSPSAALLSRLTSVATRGTTTLPRDQRDAFLFGWLDATKYSGFLEQFNLESTPPPFLLVVDTPSKRFWYEAGASANVSAMVTFLRDVATGVATTQRQGLLAWPQYVANVIGVVPTAALGAALVTVLAWGLWRFVLAGLCTGGEEAEEVPPAAGEPAVATIAGRAKAAPARRTAAAPAPGGAPKATLHLRPSFSLKAAAASGGAARQRGGSESSGGSEPATDFLTGERAAHEDLDVGEDGVRFTAVEDGAGAAGGHAGREASSEEEDSEVERLRRERAPPAGASVGSDALRKRRSRIRVDDS